MYMRFPVRPTSCSPQLLPAFSQESTPQHSNNPRASSESVAESMIREFKYDPEDKTPPKRRMKAAAGAIASMVEGNPGPSSTAPGKRKTVTDVAVSTLELDIDQQEAQQEVDQARAQASVEKGETFKYQGPPTSPTPHAQDSTAMLVDTEKILATDRVTLGAADHDVDEVYGRNILVRRNLLRTEEAMSGDDSQNDDYGSAACFLESDAQRRFEENKRLTVRSEHTEPSLSGHEDDVDESTPELQIEVPQPSHTSLNTLEPGVWIGQTNLQTRLQSTFSEAPTSSEDDAGGAEPSRMIGSVFGANMAENQSQLKGARPLASNEYGKPDAVDRSAHLSTTTLNLRTQFHPLSALTTHDLVTVWSHILAHLSPIREVDSTRDRLAEQSTASLPAPLQTESGKPPSTAASSSVLSSDTGCVSTWCSIVWNILVWAVPLAFLAGALHSLATTRALREMPLDLFTAQSKTMYSEDGSANMTMACMNGHAVGFNVSVVPGTTLGAGETEPKSWNFLYDWRADGEILSANVGVVRDIVSVMALPSFGQAVLQSMGFLGLFAAIFWLVKCFLSAVSRCWHWREDGNLFWTRTLLRHFDGGRLAAELILSGIVSAVIWATASRVLPARVLPAMSV